MKTSMMLMIAAGSFSFVSCAPTVAPSSTNVEALERQAPVTPNPNAVGDAINAANAVNYSNGRGGIGGFLPFGLGLGR